MSEIEPLIIKPQDLMRAEEFDVIGLSDAIFIACSAVNIATDIANSYVNEISA